MFAPTGHCARALAVTCAVALAAGCAAEDATPKCAQQITINKAKVTPTLAGPFKYPATEAGIFFSIEGANEAACGADGLRISWYYDPPADSAQPVEVAEICGGKEKCYVGLCNLPNPTAATHRVWAVVSDGPLKAGATRPFDFPDGTAFDAVRFDIERVGWCN